MARELDKQAILMRIKRVDPRLVIGGIFAMAMLPLMVTPVLPLIDHYNHVARFYVLAHIGTTPLLEKYYQTRWALLPDIGLDVIAMPLLRLLPPLIAAHVIVLGVLANLYGGVLYFNRSLTGRYSPLVAVLLSPLLYSYILNWGFANFLLGLGVAFWAAGWWVSTRRQPSLAVPISCIFAVLIYLSHGVAFGLYGILLASLEVGFFFNSSERRLNDLIKSLLLTSIQAVIPIAMFIYWLWIKESESTIAALAMLSQQAPAPVVHNGLYRLKTILRVEEGPAYWFDIATFVVQSVVVCLLIWYGRVRIVRSTWIALAIAVLMVAIFPSKMFGAFYISDRVPLFAALILLTSLSFVTMQLGKIDRIAYGTLVAVVVVRLCAIAIAWHSYDHDYREFQTVAAKIPPGSLTLDVMVGSGHHETNVPRCEMYGSLLITQYGQVGPLFNDPNQHPLVLTGALEKAVDSLARNALVTNERTTDFNPYMSAAASAGFDYLLVCNARLLTRPFPQGMTVIAETPRFALLRVEK